MNSFDFYSPTYFVFGRDRENDTGKYVAKFGGNRVLDRLWRPVREKIRTA